MARTKEFDERDALLAAMGVFWRQGYDGTSIPDLLQATGLSRSSLYETFSDKATLFEAAAALYFDLHGVKRIEALRNAPTAQQGLKQFFAAQIESCLDPKNPPGCLMTNTATALEALDPRIADKVRASTDALRREILALLRRAQLNGEIAAEKRVGDLAHLLVALSFGINVQARIKRDRRALQAMADGAIEAVGLR